MYLTVDCVSYAISIFQDIQCRLVTGMSSTLRWWKEQEAANFLHKTVTKITTETQMKMHSFTSLFCVYENNLSIFFMDF